MRHGCAHGGDTARNQFRFRHQTGPEAPGLHPVTGATDIQIDFVIAKIRANFCSFGQRRRFAAAKLQRHGMFRPVETQQPRPVAIQHRIGRHHFGIQPRVARQQAQKVPVKPVRPVHHRRNTKTVRAHFILPVAGRAGP